MSRVIWINNPDSIKKLQDYLQGVLSKAVTAANIESGEELKKYLKIFYKFPGYLLRWLFLFKKERSSLITNAIDSTMKSARRRHHIKLIEEQVSRCEGYQKSIFFYEGTLAYEVCKIQKFLYKN